MTKEIKQKKQDLGIFYTDQRIADFIFDILKIWKEKEEKESGRWESRKHFPSVIDPAVGEGVFLKAAIETGLTKTDYVFGLDIDEEVVKKWKQINLLKEFGGKEEDLEAHFFHQNGLDKIHWEQHTNKYRYKLKQKDINVQQFDAVVGNPPYGGVGLEKELFTDELVRRLASFEILPQKIKDDLIPAAASKIGSLFGDTKELAVSNKSQERLRAFPIEILFVERFIQLAKAGGWIGIIIPDGILTNSNSHYVREFIREKTKVEAIISLPRDAFKNVGTSAKTSILFLKKYKDQEKKQEDHPVFLASVDSLDEKNFNLVINNYKNYYNKTMSNKNLVQTTTDEKGREIVMVRVDKTLKELMEEKPAGRWDTNYWHPKFEEIHTEIGKKFLVLGNQLQENKIAFPDCVRKSRGESLGDKYSTYYFRVTEFLNTGYDWPNTKKCSDNAAKRLNRTKSSKDNVLIARSGATLGSTLIISDPPKKSCTGDLFVLEFKNSNINPYFFTLLMKTKYGKLQFNRFLYGTASPKISIEHIRALKIPIISKDVQNNIETEYKKMSKYHDKAMEVKKNNNESEYKKNIETAEKMLKDLIAKTEAVIRGERKDVI